MDRANISTAAFGVFNIFPAGRLLKTMPQWCSWGPYFLSLVYTLRLIWPISYPGECDLMVHTRKYSVILSRMRFVTKSARLIAVFKRTFN